MSSQNEAKKKQQKQILLAGGLVVAGLVSAYMIYKHQQNKSLIKANEASIGIDLDDEKETKEMELTDDNCCIKSSDILYSTPMNAFMNGKREKVMYVTCTRTDQTPKGQDFIAVVNVDPHSDQYCQIIKEINVGVGEEVHHSGWNACASCFGCNDVERKYLVVPSFVSGNIHFIDVKKQELKHTVSGKYIKEKYGLSFPHTPHCLKDGNILISFLGDDGSKNSKGLDFLLINGKTFEIKGRYIDSNSKRPNFGYDYWYQPYFNIMISSEWGKPKAFSKGFDLNDVKNGLYGNSIHLWEFNTGKLIKTIEFDKSEVIMPLETRFLHNPKKGHAFIGCALTSNMIHIYYDEYSKEWKTNSKYIVVEPIKVDNWVLPEMPALITDFLISMDDKYIYFANWLHGDVRQYDISDVFNPKLVGQVFVGGLLKHGSPYKINKNETILKTAPKIPTINGSIIGGGPQMMQLSLDGKRLYITNSLYSAYDKQFYPDLLKNGGQIILIDCDHKNGGMKLNESFMIDFGKSINGPARPHEMRYPGGDCTSDIYLP